jgi:hypothetical protein
VRALARKRQTTARLRKALPLQGSSLQSFGFELSVHTGLAPNALTQSNIEIKGNEPFAPGVALVFDLQAGFDPYSLQFTIGTGSVAQNAGVPLALRHRGHTRLTSLLALHEIVKFTS